MTYSVAARDLAGNLGPAAKAKPLRAALMRKLAASQLKVARVRSGERTLVRVRGRVSDARARCRVRVGTRRLARLQAEGRRSVLRQPAAAGHDARDALAARRARPREAADAARALAAKSPCSGGTAAASARRSSSRMVSWKRITRARGRGGARAPGAPAARRRAARSGCRTRAAQRPPRRPARRPARRVVDARVDARQRHESPAGARAGGRLGRTGDARAPRGHDAQRDARALGLGDRRRATRALAARGKGARPRRGAGHAHDRRDSRRLRRGARPGRRRRTRTPRRRRA